MPNLLRPRLSWAKLHICHGHLSKVNHKISLPLDRRSYQNTLQSAWIGRNKESGPFA